MTVVPNDIAAAPDDASLFQDTREWQIWRVGSTPSGSTLRLSFAPEKATCPSGSTLPFGRVLGSGMVYAIVIAAAHLGAASEAQGAGGRPEASRGMSVAPAVAPRRREDDERIDAVNGIAVTPADAVTAGDVVTSAAQTAGDVPTDASAAVSTAGEQLELVEDALSLSMTQIAEIMRVARGTLYRWKQHVEWPRGEDDGRRLLALARVARRWRELSDEYLGRLVATPIGDDTPSLYAQLRADDWDQVAIDQTLRALAERLAERRRERRATLGLDGVPTRRVTAETRELERIRERLRRVL